MHVAMYQDLKGVHLPLSNFGSIPSKREGSNDTDESATRVAIEWVFTSLSIYEDTRLIVDKDIKLKWKEVNDAFVGTFREDLKDHQVYLNIQKLGLYQIACRYPMLPCMEMIH